MQRIDPGPWLVTAAYDLAIVFSPITDAKITGARPQRVTCPHSQINRLVVSNDNFIAAAANPMIMLYDPPPNNTRAAQFSGHQANVTDCLFIGTNLYSCSEDRTWMAWDVRASMPHSMKGSGGSALNAIVALPTQTHLITGDDKGSLELWDIRAPDKPVLQLRISQSSVRSLAICRDGTRVIAACHDGKVVILNSSPEALTEATSFQAHKEPPLRVVIAPDESTFVTTSADSSAKLWNFADCTEIGQLKEPGQDKWVWDAAYARPDCVVTVGTDKFARTWDCNTRQCVHSSKDGHAKGIIACAIWPASVLPQ
jgi:G protein beta subunit-like protein